jgi:hypothetical protein
MLRPIPVIHLLVPTKRRGWPSYLSAYDRFAHVKKYYVDQIKERWEGNEARMGEMISTFKILVGKPEGKRPLGRPKRRWEDNIEMDQGSEVRSGLDASGSG